MCLADGPTQTVRGPGHGDQVDVIGHEAVRPDFNLLGKAELGHQLQVAEVILVAEKRLLPSVSPLCDVVRQTRGDDTCQSGHEGRLSAAGSPVKNYVWCPRNLPLPTGRRKNCV